MLTRHTAYIPYYGDEEVLVITYRQREDGVPSIGDRRAVRLPPEGGGEAWDIMDNRTGPSGGWMSNPFNILSGVELHQSTEVFSEAEVLLYVEHGTMPVSFQNLVRET